MAQFRARVKLWMADPEKRILLGEGGATLLENIAKVGSITAAAAAMGISYRTAWHRIHSMNDAFPRPLVQTTVGGPRGGGARLTTAGETVLREFSRLRKDVEKYLEEETGQVRKPRR